MTTAEQRNEYFGKLLKTGIQSISTVEGVVNTVIEEELATEVGLTGAAIQKYKTGKIPNDNNLIRNIAISAVRRGMMGYVWAKQFLDEANYPATYNLLEELFPSKSDIQKEEILDDNLPAPSYSKFVMRTKEFDSIVDGLQNRSAIVLIRSFGGMGKTSLAREVASQCISKQKEYAWLPKFETAIWVTDANSPGTTNLTVVMDTIANTLGFHEISKLPYEDKSNEISRILKMNKILLIVDNFETIKDDALLKWLTILPEPSKCIITTREYHRAFRNNTRDIELGGMNKSEAHEFVKNKMTDLDISQTKNKVEDFDPLVNTCGGNPKAIEMALGIIKHDKRTLKATLEELVSIKGELFKDLFKRAWDLLNEDAKNILRLMAMFPYGTKEWPLSKISMISENDLQSALSKLIDLSLINTKEEGISVEPFYFLHPLVNAFANQKLKESSDFDKSTRVNWLNYYKELSSQIGFCWKDIEKLKILDEDGLREGIEYAIEWANNNKDFDAVIAISENIKYYFYIRGIWSSKLNLLRADAAKKNLNVQAQFDALVYHLNILCKQGNIDEAEYYLPILNDLQSQNTFSENSLIDYNHAIGLYDLLKENYDDAIKRWEINLSNTAIHEHQLNANRRWLGICYFEKGDLKKAKEILNQLADDIGDEKLIHSALSANIYLSKIDFIEGKHSNALTRIKASLDIVEKTKDEAFLPEFEVLYAQYLITDGNIEEAKDYLQRATNHYEKLGRYDKSEQTIIQLNQITKKR